MCRFLPWQEVFRHTRTIQEGLAVVVGGQSTAGRGDCLWSGGGGVCGVGQGWQVQGGRAAVRRSHAVRCHPQVDLILHPLKSELNFPIGQKLLIDLAPDRWRVPQHLLAGLFCAQSPEHLAPRFKESQAALQILAALAGRIAEGIAGKQMQRSPHLVLLAPDFYHAALKPILRDWLALYLAFEQVGAASLRPGQGCGFWRGRAGKY